MNLAGWVRRDPLGWHLLHASTLASFQENPPKLRWHLAVVLMTTHTLVASMQVPPLLQLASVLPVHVDTYSIGSFADCKQGKGAETLQPMQPPT